VPLVGFGTLAAGLKDAEELASRFEGACQPWHDGRGTTGYKSFTFTLPKELSLLAEGQREAARAQVTALFARTKSRMTCMADEAVGSPARIPVIAFRRSDADVVPVTSYALFGRIKRR